MKNHNINNIKNFYIQENLTHTNSNNNYPIVNTSENKVSKITIEDNKIPNFTEENFKEKRRLLIPKDFKSHKSSSQNFNESNKNQYSGNLNLKNSVNFASTGVSGNSSMAFLKGIKSSSQNSNSNSNYESKKNLDSYINIKDQQYVNPKNYANDKFLDKKYLKENKFLNQPYNASKNSDVNMTEKYFSDHSMKKESNKTHLKKKLKNDIIGFFNNHRDSALLIGNSKYKDKSPDHYLNDYYSEHNSPEKYENELNYLIEQEGIPVSNKYIKVKRSKEDYIINNSQNQGFKKYKAKKRLKSRDNNNSNNHDKYNNKSMKINDFLDEYDSPLSNYECNDNEKDFVENKNKLSYYKERLIKKIAKDFNVSDVKNQNIIIFEQNIQHYQPENKFINNNQYINSYDGYVKENSYVDLKKKKELFKKSQLNGKSRSQILNEKSRSKGKIQRINRSKRSNSSNKRKMYYQQDPEDIDDIDIDTLTEKMPNATTFNHASITKSFKELVPDNSRRNINYDNKTKNIDHSKYIINDNENKGLRIINTASSFTNNKIKNTSESKISGLPKKSPNKYNNQYDQNTRNKYQASLNYNEGFKSKSSLNSDVKSSIINNFTSHSPEENEFIYKKAIEKILEKSHNNIELTPIPIKKNVLNDIEKRNYEEAERTAVMLRKIEYSENLKAWKSQMIKEYSGNLFNELLLEAHIIRIQRWWKKISNKLFRKNPKIVKIQANFRGYLYRLFCLDRIKSLIRFSQLDLYFKIRNASQCLGILAVNYAKLFRHNFLKEHAIKIISLFRRFRIMKKRLLTNFANSIKNRYKKIQYKYVFNRIKNFDISKHAGNIIKHALRRFILVEQLKKKVIRTYYEKPDKNYYNPLIAIYLNNKARGKDFHNYIHMKRFILGFVLSKFKYLLRLHRLKKFIEFLKMKINEKQLLHKTIFYDKFVKKTYYSLELSMKVDKLKEIFYLYFKTDFYNKFMKFRQNIAKLRKLEILSKHFKKTILNQFAWIPLLQKLKFIKKSTVLTTLLHSMYTDRKSYVLNQINSFCNLRISRDDLLNKILEMYRQKRYRRYLNLWLKKATSNVYLKELYHNVSMSCNKLEEFINFKRYEYGKSFFNIVKTNIGTENFVNTLSIYQISNYKKAFNNLKETSNKHKFLENKKIHLFKKYVKKRYFFNKNFLTKYFNKFKFINSMIKLKVLESNDKTKSFVNVVNNTYVKNLFSDWNYFLLKLKNHNENTLKLLTFATQVKKILNENRRNTIFTTLRHLDKETLYAKDSSLIKTLGLKFYITKKNNDIRRILKNSFSKLKTNGMKDEKEKKISKILTNIMISKYLKLNNNVEGIKKKNLIRWQGKTTKIQTIEKINFIHRKFKQFLLKKRLINLKSIFNKSYKSKFVNNTKETLIRCKKNMKISENFVKNLSTKEQSFKSIFFKNFKLINFLRIIILITNESKSLAQRHFFVRINKSNKEKISKIIKIQSLSRRLISIKKMKNLLKRSSYLNSLIIRIRNNAESKINSVFNIWRKNSYLDRLIKARSIIINGFKKMKNNRKKSALYKRITNLYFKNQDKLKLNFEKYQRIIKYLKFLEKLISVQRLFRMFLFYKNSKREAMKKIHDEWANHLQYLKSLKVNFKIVFHLISKFGLGDFINKLKKKAFEGNRKKSIKKMFDILKNRLRIFLNFTLGNYTGLKNIENEKYGFDKHQLGSQEIEYLRKKRIKQILTNLLILKSSCNDYKQEVLFNKFIYRSQKLCNVKKIIKIQSVIRASILRYKLGEKILKTNKLYYMFYGLKTYKTNKLISSHLNYSSNNSNYNSKESTNSDKNETNYKSSLIRNFLSRYKHMRTLLKRNQNYQFVKDSIVNNNINKIKEKLKFNDINMYIRYIFVNPNNYLDHSSNTSSAIRRLAIIMHKGFYLNKFCKILINKLSSYKEVFSKLVMFSNSNDSKIKSRVDSKIQSKLLLIFKIIDTLINHRLSFVFKKINSKSRGIYCNLNKSIKKSQTINVVNLLKNHLNFTLKESFNIIKSHGLNRGKLQVLINKFNENSKFKFIKDLLLLGIKINKCRKFDKEGKD